MSSISIEKNGSLSLFSVVAIEKLFMHFGQFHPGCFSVFQRHFADGSFDIQFDYPTDFNQADALFFINSMEEQVLKMNMEEIQKIVSVYPPNQNVQIHVDIKENKESGPLVESIRKEFRSTINAIDNTRSGEIIFDFIRSIKSILFAINQAYEIRIIPLFAHDHGLAISIVVLVLQMKNHKDCLSYHTFLIADTMSDIHPNRLPCDAFDSVMINRIEKVLEAEYPDAYKNNRLFNAGAMVIPQGFKHTDLSVVKQVLVNALAATGMELGRNTTNEQYGLILKDKIHAQLRHNIVVTQQINNSLPRRADLMIELGEAPDNTSVNQSRLSVFATTFGFMDNDNKFIITNTSLLMPTLSTMLLNLASVFKGFLDDRITKISADGFSISMDIEHWGFDQHDTITFAYLAQKDPNAMKEIFDTANSLTNGEFSKLYSEDKPILIDWDTNEIYFGHYIGEQGGVRDIRHLNESCLITDSFDLHCDVDFTITSKGKRITFDPAFLSALVKAIENTGLVWN